MKKILWLLPLFAIAIALLAGSAFAAGGTGPGDALLPIGTPQTVAPHSAQWYRFDYGGNRSQITATLDDHGAGGIRLAIYTPDEITTWQNGNKLVAIGVGGSFVGHDLGWVGQFPTAGRYYAVVYNDSDASVSVSVRVTGDSVTTVVNVVPTATPLPNPFATVTPLGQGFSGKLAFVDSAGGVLYTVNGDGSNLQRVSFGMDPQWNHSGTQIALARQGPIPGIFTVNANGSNENMLYQTNEPRAPDWSPDDSMIVFSYQTTIGQATKQCFSFRGRSFCFSKPPNTQWKLAEVNSSGGGFADVRATDDAFTPTWNADGVTIAFNDLSIGIMQMNINNDYAPFPFVGDLRITAADYNPLKLMSPQYSPDGKQIVYVVLQQPAWQIAVANADGTNQHLLTQIDPLDFVHPNNVAPVWSPDGKQILFLSDRNGKWEFFLMNADGTGQQQVLKNISDQIPIHYEFQSERMLSWTK
jgi:Tol biopolymer transport system component